MKNLKIGVASDHAGFLYKHEIVTDLENKGLNVIDLGVYNEKPSDYPDVAAKVATARTSEKIKLIGVF